MFDPLISSKLILKTHPNDLITDSDGKILACGSSWLSENAVGKHLIDLYPNHQVDFDKQITLATQTSETITFFITQKNERVDFEVIQFENKLLYIKVSSELGQIDEKRDSDTYRLLFEKNVAAVFRTRVSGEILEINQAYANVFGFESIEELKRCSAEQFYPDSETRQQYIEFLRRKGSLENYPIRNYNRFGKEMCLLANVRILQDEEGEIIEGTLIDISRQKEVEEQLEKQKKQFEKLSTILQNISDEIYVFDEEGHFVFANKVTLDRLGIDEHEVNQLKIFDIAPFFSDVTHFKNHIENLKKDGTLVVDAYHRNIRTGELFPTELSVRFEYIDEQGFLIATGRDITQKLHDQEKISEQEKHIHDLNWAINSSSLVSITDANGTILDVNDKFCLVSEYSKEELIGSNHSLVSSHTHTQEFWREFYEMINKGQTWIGEICNRKKSGEFYWVKTVIYPFMNEGEKPNRFMSIRQEITREKEAEKIIQKQLNFQDLLMSIALRLINVDPDHLDAEINDALKEIGVFVGADRAYIFDYDHESETSSNLFEWCRSGIEPQIDNLQNVPFSDIPEWTKRHFSGEIMDLPSVEDLPASLLKKLLEVQDIKSLLAIPLMDGSNCRGFIGFDSVRHIHPFNENDKKILELFSYMLVNIQKRIYSIRQVEQANERIKDVNLNLQQRIEEEMAKSAQMNQSMANLDKMAMIGELTSGLAHDLNTPLGAIKVGAESVRFTLENLFKKVLEGNSIEQVHFACSRAVETNFNMFVGGIQTLKEKKDMLEFMDEHYPNVENKNELVSLFIKARITADESDVIHKVMQTPNQIEFLELIYHIQAIRTFIDTIIEAGEKAGSVVKSLRFYLRNGENREAIQVDLKDNIHTVVNVFNHMVKELEVDFSMQIDECSCVKGFPDRLYQLWSNLLKNALEATGQGGKVWIDSEQTSNKVRIAIGNTGNPIPAEHIRKIWEKFFSTKSANGTGLGLSIVKRVVEEHGAKIDLKSDLEGTVFTVEFDQKDCEV
jgi:PAS domain S-box-containing protein